MKSKQLANVLIKVLGFSVCLYALPSFISGVLVGVSHLQSPPAWFTFLPMIAYGIGAAVQIMAGAIIISNSQKVADWMFKGEDE